MIKNIRIQTRTKTGSLVTDPSQLYNREIIAGDIEKSLFYKDIDSELFRFSPVDDTTSDEYRTWSSTKIENYVTSGFSPLGHTHTQPTKHIYFSANGVTSNPNAPLLTGQTVAGGLYTPRVYVNIQNGGSGFFNFIVPTDCDNVIKLTTLYSDISGNGGNDATLQIYTSMFMHNTNIETPSWSASFGQTLPYLAPGQIGVYTQTINIALFGTGSEGQMATLNITGGTDLSTGSMRFYGIRLDY